MEDTEYRRQNSDNRLKTTDGSLRKESRQSCYPVRPIEKTKPIGHPLAGNPKHEALDPKLCKTKPICVLPQRTARSRRQ